MHCEAVRRAVPVESDEFIGRERRPERGQCSERLVNQKAVFWDTLQDRQEAKGREEKTLG